MRVAINARSLNVSTLKTIITGASALSISNAVSRVVSFFSVVIITRALSLYEYGVVTLVLAISGPVLALVNLGLDELIIAEVSRMRAEKNIGGAKQLQRSYFAMQWLLLIVIICFGSIFHSFLEKRYGAAFQDESSALLIYIAVQVARTSMITFLNIHKNFLTIAKINSVEPILRLFGAFLLLVTHTFSITTTILLYSAASLCTILLSLKDINRVLTEYRDVAIAQKQILWSILKVHGKWQALLALLSSILANIRYYFIKLLLSTEAVSIFAVAQSMYGAVSSLIPLKTVVAPLIAERVHLIERVRLFVAKAGKYALFLYFVVMVGTMISAPLMIAFFFPKYQQSIFIFELMALRFPLNTFSLLHAPLFVALKEQRFLSLLSFVNAALVAILAVPLIYFFGLPGLVFEGLITTSVIMALREYRLRKKYHIPTISWGALVHFDAIDRAIIEEVRNKVRLS